MDQTETASAGVERRPAAEEETSPATPTPPRSISSTRRDWKETLQAWDKQWLILPKFIYFTLNCAIYATHNYTAMYFYRMWKLEVYQFGAVSSLSAVQFVGALFWGQLADRTGRHKSILLVCTVLYGFFFCLLELKPFESSVGVRAKIIYSATMYGVSCFFVSSLFPLVDAQVFSILARDPNFTKETFGRQRLWGTLGHGLITLAVGTSIYLMGYVGMFMVLVLSCASFIFFVLVGIPADIKIIRRPPHHQDDSRKPIGKEELVSAAERDPRPKVSGTSAETGDVKQSIMSYTKTTTATVATGAGTEIGGKINEEDEAAPLKDSSEDGHHVITVPAHSGETNIGWLARLARTPTVRVLLNPHFFFLALVILAAGYVRSVMSNFLAFYMQTEMKQSEIMVAIAIVFRMASEISIFFYNKQLLHLLGLHWMLIIAQGAGLIRVLAYSLLPPDGNWFYLSFAIELLKGTSTGCLISAGVRMANDIAPPDCVNTGQSYISGIYSGLSLAIGGALGGLIIYWLPSHSVAAMFRVTFWMGLGALLLCIFKYSLIDRAIMVPASWKRPTTHVTNMLHVPVVQTVEPLGSSSSIKTQNSDTTVKSTRV